MNHVEAIGTIIFDPEDVSKKHGRQSSWKKVAMLMLKDDTAEYYAWFIRRRYNVVLNKPLRGPHITFINDREKNMNGQWSAVREKWDGNLVSISLNVDVRTNSEFWCLNVLPNGTLKEIRMELGLGDPFFPFHLTVGYPNDKNEHHSRYIHDLLSRGMIG